MKSLKFDEGGKPVVIETVADDSVKSGGVEAAPSLSPPRFTYLLALTGLEDVWDALELALRDTDRPSYAMLKAQRAKGRFHLERTLALIGQFQAAAADAAPDADLSEEAITAAWELAAVAEI